MRSPDTLVTRGQDALLPGHIDALIRRECESPLNLYGSDLIRTIEVSGSSFLALHITSI